MRPTLKQSVQKPQQFLLVASNNKQQLDSGNAIITTESLRPNTMKIRINPLTQRPSTSNISNALTQLQHDSINNNTQRTGVASTLASNLANTIQANFMSTQMVVAAAVQQQQQQLQQQTESNEPKLNNSTAQVTGAATMTTTTGPVRQVQRRRVRRKGSSHQDDLTEHLTEMSVRGLNLFRYAKIFEGIYQCTECAKENIQKTFKNKYSFQRHAFLYHEGTSRKVFPCPVCSKEFSRPDKMKNHMKTTHDCITTKETVYPLNFIAGGGGEMPNAAAQTTTTTQKQTKQHQTTVQATTTATQEQKSNETTQSEKQTSANIRIDNVLSAGYTTQIIDAAQHIKIEVSD